MATWEETHRPHQIHAFARRWLRADVEGRKPGAVLAIRAGILQEAASYRITEAEIMASVESLTTPVPNQDSAVRAMAEVIVKSRQVELPTVECPTCRGSGAIAVGPWGKRPGKTQCRLCNGKGKIERGVADAFRVGVEMGRSSAYIGHYDQYDRGSLMFSDVDDPYAPEDQPRVIKGAVNGRTGF